MLIRNIIIVIESKDYRFIFILNEKQQHCLNGGTVESEQSPSSHAYCLTCNLYI